jgi:hypothetical protein
MASIAGHGITLLSSCAGGVVQCNANELDLAIPSDCTMIFFIGWKGLLAFVILISVLDDAGGFDIWASLSSAILGLFSFVLCKAEGCGPAMGEFCKLGQNLGCKSCSMLLLLLLALHGSGLEGSQLWGSQLACCLALFQSYYCLTDELLGHSILGIEHHWLLGQSVFSCISCMIFYLLERNSQSPAEANHLIWYSCEDRGV